MILKQIYLTLHNYYTWEDNNSDTSTVLFSIIQLYLKRITHYYIFILENIVIMILKRIINDCIINDCIINILKNKYSNTEKQ